MRRLFNHIALLVCVLCTVGVMRATGQTILVHASVDRNVVTLADQVSFSVHISGFSSFSDVSTPVPPATEGLALVQAYPRTEPQSIAVRGRIENAITYHWAYRPVRTGVVRLREMQITIRGRAFQTAPIEVQVTGTEPARDPSRPMVDSTTPAERRKATVGAGDVFIRALQNNRQPYVGEQVLVEYWLYHREGVSLRGELKLAGSWDAEGLWREELDVDLNPAGEWVRENGTSYKRFLLKRAAVFPTRTGNLHIDPLRIRTEATATTRSGDPWEDRMVAIGDYRPVEVASPAIAIQARALPGGAPAGFAGAAGTYRLDVDVDDRNAGLGGSVTVVAKVSGAGNLATLPSPVFAAPAAFEQYDPQVATEIRRSGSQVQGTRTYTYVLVPRKSGPVELPGVRFVYFDPGRRQYATLQSKSVSIDLRVASGSGTAVDVAAGEDTAGRTGAVAFWQRMHVPAIVRQPVFWVWLVLPLVGAAGVRYAVRGVKKRTKARNAHAAPVPPERYLARARKLLREGEPEGFYDALEKGLRAALARQVPGIEPGLTRRQIDLILSEAGMDDADRSGVLALFEQCDLARFAPVRPDRSRMERDLEAATQLVARFSSQGLFSRPQLS